MALSKTLVDKYVNADMFVKDKKTFFAGIKAGSVKMDIINLLKVKEDQELEIDKRIHTHRVSKLLEIVMNY